VVKELLPGTGVTANAFFMGLAESVRDFGPRNRRLLQTRAAMQASIDAWHIEHPTGSDHPEGYRRYLEGLGYLHPSCEEFQITTTNVDEEITTISGPQLVVPVTNARYALNAVNARWGSLYDALYGTDALGKSPVDGPYDVARGNRVIEWVRSFLDDVVPLASGSHARCIQYSIKDGNLVAILDDGTQSELREPDVLLGHTGEEDQPSSILLQHHALKIEIRLDRTDSVGCSDMAGVADVAIEAAITVIIDFEDSVATVDAEDKTAAYRNWLELMTGQLEARVDKPEEEVRRINKDRYFSGVDGSSQRIRSRALVLARTVGLLMSTSAVLDDQGLPIPEGLLDTFVVSAAAIHDHRRPEWDRNSRQQAIYLVTPKLHGPEEVEYACDLFAAVEKTLDLPSATLKMGIMDEERRTTVNLHACIRAAADRVAFINTGFLDRTGDEIHTSMQAGPVARKADMRSAPWIQAYEDWNVDIGLRCGFSGRAQIGKGMWAMPDRMHAMLSEKIAHPLAGANCAWVPSPTAATLHATHYHRVDVRDRQRELANLNRAHLDQLLALPVTTLSLNDDERRHELDNNIQSILGYVVRWVDQGIGCSKVPDLNHVQLMEDRATCRISSQHVANWLLHGVVSLDEVESSLRRMARFVDAQNADHPHYQVMAPRFDGPAFCAARNLIIHGLNSPSGYTEPILHSHRQERKLFDLTAGQ
jgi:malate synthase